MPLTVPGRPSHSRRHWSRASRKKPLDPSSATAPIPVVHPTDHPSTHVSFPTLPPSADPTSTQPRPARTLSTPQTAPSISTSLLPSLLPSTLSPFAPRRSFPIRVSKSVLRNATDNGLPKLYSQLFARMRCKVLVESSLYSRSDSLFYAPFSHTDLSSIVEPTPTEFAAVVAESNTNHLVCASHDFEIRIVGMHVTPQDGLIDSENELLLYSLATKPSVEHVTASDLPDDSRRSGRNTRRENMDSNDEAIGSESSRRQHDRRYRERSMEPNPHLGERDEPTIHFDPLTDGHDQGSVPNTFRAVPGSKALLYRHLGSSTQGRGARSVSVRFTVIEIDTVADAQRKVMQRLGGMLNHQAKTKISLGRFAPMKKMPFGRLASPAMGGFMSGASSLGQAGMEGFSKNHHVLSKDVEFALLENVPTETASAVRESSGTDASIQTRLYADNYLRYGYYFFLAEKVDARLYAQTDTSSQNVPLLLRRMGARAEHGALGERQFFPLTGIDYVVVKVTPGVRSGYKVMSSREKKEHRERLEDILNMNQAIEILSGRM